MARVFVSYSHDSDEHKARVRAFVTRLRGDGIVVVYDEDFASVGGPDEGWPRWCERQIVELDYVLACCTAMFHERFEGNNPKGEGQGVAWEAISIRQYLYGNGNANQRVRPLVLEESHRDFIPNALRSYSHFLPTSEQSYANLLGWLNIAAPIIVAGAGPASDPAVRWPPRAADFPRHLADRVDEFAAFTNMLAGHGPKRVLLVQGPSNTGKSALLHECLSYAAHQCVAHAHVDFKGGLSLEEAFETLVLDLGEATLPETAARELSARSLKVIAELQALRTPCFIAFDTYQEAPQGAREWIATLLARISRCPAVVVAVAGQAIPEHSGRTWAPLAHPAALPPISVDDWFSYAERAHGSIGVQRAHIEALTLITNGSPGQISAMIDVLARSLPQAGRT